MVSTLPTSLDVKRQNDSNIVADAYRTSDTSNVYVVGSFMMNSIVQPRPSVDLRLHDQYFYDSWISMISSDTRHTQHFIPPNLVKELGIERLTKLFQLLRDDWKKDIQFLSSAIKIVNHPSYQFIIALGPAMIPLIIEDLRKELNHWFYALRVLTDYVPEKRYRGNMGRMRSAWLLWAEDNESYLEEIRRSMETD